MTETTAPLIMLIVNAGIMAVLWFGRIEISAGEATLGQTVAVINYSLRTIGAMSALSSIMATFSRAIASSQRVAEVMSADAATDVTAEQAEQANERKRGVSGISDYTGPDAIQGEVEFENVSFSYPGSEIAVLEEISFKVKPGERVAIMGATGSGKSSLVGLIPRLYEQNHGVISIDGVDSSELDIAKLRGAIGYVPQEVLLFTGSVRDNIAWGMNTQPGKRSSGQLLRRKSMKR